MFSTKDVSFRAKFSSFAGSFVFLHSFEENCNQKCSQVLTVRLLLAKERNVSGFNASRAVVLISRTGMTVEKRTFLKIPNGRHYLLKTHAKRKKNRQKHWEWHKKPFRNYLEARKLGSVRVEVKRCWTAFLSLWTAASKTESEKVFTSHCDGRRKMVHYDNPKRRRSWGMPGRASTSTARPNIHGAKVMLCIWLDQLDIVHYELLKPSETVTGDRYRTQLMRLSPKLEEKGHSTERDMKKLSSSIAMLGFISHSIHERNKLRPLKETIMNCHPIT